jgi:hypothetical protein
MEAMSDTNEERLLTELLRDIGQADAQPVPHGDLEARVMARWDGRNAETAAPDGRRAHHTRIVWAAFAVAAVVLLTIALSLGSPESPAPAPAAPVDAIVETPEILDPAAEPRPVRAPVRRPRSARRPVLPASEVVDFIPLGPMAPSNLSGSFQIVPVRINNTPAHLLLGEDGMAQGILWRSR